MPVDRSEFLRGVLSRLDQYFGLANLKASLLLPVNAVVLGSMITAGPVVAGGLASEPSAVSYIAQCLHAVTLVALLASSLASLFVVFAFLKSGNRGSAYQSLLFFGSIASMTKDDFVAQLLSAQASDLDRDLAEQVYLLSAALRRKYLALNVAVVGTGIAMVVVTATLIVWGVKP